MSSSFLCFADYVLLGTKFSSEADAYKSYRDHGKSCGFSVRKSSTRKTRDGIRLLMKIFVCSNEGLKGVNAGAPKCYSKCVTPTWYKAMV